MTDKFIPGVTPVPASDATWGDEEKDAMCAQIRSGWLTAGPKNKAFEEALAARWGTRYAVTCNSGSSANLLAVAAMIERGIWKAGDEIITTATSFPTTINPLLQYGLVPVFVDVELETYNAPLRAVGEAMSPSIKGVMLAHTMGHPFDYGIVELARATRTPLIEDCCDAFGASWTNGKLVGTQGVMATCSFFPAHHIMTGEGGAVFTSNEVMRKIVESISAWGRDCYCDPGQENTCGKRFDCSFKGMPAGYDHKYTYTTLGYNLKMTEVQAVCGLEQLRRVDSFIEYRQRNWQHLNCELSHLSDKLILPTLGQNAAPSWFGFVITLRETGRREALQRYLAERKIGSRLLFGGNITRQPYMKGRKFRVVGALENSDKVMADTLWVGCHPGLTLDMLDYIAESIEEFL